MGVFFKLPATEAEPKQRASVPLGQGNRSELRGAGAAGICKPRAGKGNGAEKDLQKFSSYLMFPVKWYNKNLKSV